MKHMKLMILAIVFCALVVGGLTACSSNQGSYEPLETTPDDSVIMEPATPELDDEPISEERDTYELVVLEPIDPFTETERRLSVGYTSEDGRISSSIHVSIFDGAKGQGEQQLFAREWHELPMVVGENDLIVPLSLSQTNRSEAEIVDTAFQLRFELFEGQELYLRRFGEGYQLLSGDSVLQTTEETPPVRIQWELVLIWRDYFGDNADSPVPIITAEGYTGTSAGTFFRLPMGSMNLSIEDQRFVITGFNYDGHGEIFHHE